MLSAHFTTLEMGARALTLLGPTSVMYLTPSNPLIAELSRRNRDKHTVQAVTSEQIRELLQNLKNNLPVWYAPDQRYTGKNSEIVPFFGVAGGVQCRHLAAGEDLRRAGAALLSRSAAPTTAAMWSSIHPPLRQLSVRRRGGRHAPLPRADRSHVRDASGAVPVDVQALQAAGPDDDPYRRMKTCCPYSGRITGRPGSRSAPCACWSRCLFHCSSGSAAASASLIVRLPLSFVRIARRNLELCLPELAAAERETHAEGTFPQPRRRHFRNCDQLVELEAARSQADAARRRATFAGGTGARPRRDSAQRAFHDAGNRRSRAVRRGSRRASCIARRATRCWNAS